MAVSVEKTARLFDPNSGRMIISGTPWQVSSLHTNREDAVKRAERLQSSTRRKLVSVRVAKAAFTRGRDKWAVVTRWKG